jgi:hypothetical protein
VEYFFRCEGMILAGVACVARIGGGCFIRVIITVVLWCGGARPDPLYCVGRSRCPLVLRLDWRLVCTATGDVGFGGGGAARGRVCVCVFITSLCKGTVPFRGVGEKSCPALAGHASGVGWSISHTCCASSRARNHFLGRATRTALRATRRQINANGLRARMRPRLIHRPVQNP